MPEIWILERKFPPGGTRMISAMIDARIIEAISPERLSEMLIGFVATQDDEDNLYLKDMLEPDEIATLSSSILDAIKQAVTGNSTVR